MRAGSLLLLLMGLLVAFGTGCPPRDEPPEVTRGRAAYGGTCTSCHNLNPALDGSIGPAIKGSSRALVEAKLLRGEYPSGYTPKRDTKVMPPMPAMAGSVDDIVAFLNAK